MSDGDFSPYSVIFDVDISENVSDGVSDAYAIGKNVYATAPTSIQCPADLEGVDRIKVQVSNDDETYFDLVDEDGTVYTLALVASAAVVVTAGIQVGVLGWGFMRLVTLDGSDAAEEPTDDVRFIVRFAPAKV